MKSYKLTNISDKNVVFPESISHVVPYVVANDEVVVQCSDSDIAVINKLSSVGIIVSSKDSNLLGKAENEYAKYEEKIAELEGKIIEVMNENDSLKEEIVKRDNKITALEKKISAKAESVLEDTSTATAKIVGKEKK